MISISMRYKSAILATVFAASASLGAMPDVMVSTIGAAADPAPAVVGMSNARIAAIVGFVGVWAMWVRLVTKGSKWNYKLDDWREDFDTFLNSLNIFDAESRATLMKLFDKWIVGRRLSIIDVEYKMQNDSEDGRMEKCKDKKIKTKPFGLMGLVDGYIFYQLEKTNELIKEVRSIGTLLSNPNLQSVLLINE